MLRYAEKLTSSFTGFDYMTLTLLGGSDADQLHAIIDGANYVFSQRLAGTITVHDVG